VQHDLDSPSGFDWKFDAAWQRVVDDRTTRNFGAVERRYESNKSDLYGLTLNVSGDADTLSWIAGVDLYYDEVRSTRSEENIIDGTVAMLAPRFPDGSTVRQAGLFTNLNWYVADRHTISTGIRYNDVRIELPDGTAISPGRMSGDVGWIFNASDTWQLVANLGYWLAAHLCQLAIRISRIQTELQRQDYIRINRKRDARRQRYRTKRQRGLIFDRWRRDRADRFPDSTDSPRSHA
jgi:heme exporter protein D